MALCISANYSNNTLSKVSADERLIYNIHYGLYASTGIFTVFSNILVFTTIGRSRKLRKKYFLTLFLAGGDMTLGLGYALAAFRRLEMIQAGVHKVMVEQWECMMKPSNWMFNIGDNFPNMITPVISFERFLAITWPIKFAKEWPTDRIFGTAGVVCVLITSGFLITGIVNAWYSKECFWKFCFANFAVGPKFYADKNKFVIFLVVFTACFYALAVVKMIKQRKMLKHGTVPNSSTKNQLEHQIRVTKQFLYIVVSTSVCVMMPMLCSAVLINDREAYVKIVPFFWSIHSLNSGINFFVYMATNPELRKSFRSLIVCWKTATVAPNG